MLIYLRCRHLLRRSLRNDIHSARKKRKRTFHNIFTQPINLALWSLVPGETQTKVVFWGVKKIWRSLSRSRRRILKMRSKLRRSNLKKRLNWSFRCKKYSQGLYSNLLDQKKPQICWTWVWTPVELFKRKRSNWRFKKRRSHQLQEWKNQSNRAWSRTLLMILSMIVTLQNTKLCLRHLMFKVRRIKFYSSKPSSMKWMIKRILSKQLFRKRKN